MSQGTVVPAPDPAASELRQEQEIGQNEIAAADVAGVTLGDESPIPRSAGNSVPSFPAGNGAAAPPFPHAFDFLLDVRIIVSVEVGRVEMPVRQVMELGPGAVIELQRNASEPVEIHANGRCIGRGEVVIVGEQFGVRITELGAAS